MIIYVMTMAVLMETIITIYRSSTTAIMIKMIEYLIRTGFTYV